MDCEAESNLGYALIDIAARSMGGLKRFHSFDGVSGVIQGAFRYGKRRLREATSA
jgi:hypothetical protein